MSEQDCCVNCGRDVSVVLLRDGICRKCWDLVVFGSG